MNGTPPLRVLMIEDSEDDATLVLHELRRGGYDPVSQRVETAEAMRAALAGQSWDVILVDYALPQLSFEDVIAIYKEWGVDVPFIIVSGKIGEERAVAAMKAGAHDYVMKDNLQRLARAVERELREAETRRRIRAIQDELERSERKFHALFEAAADAIVLVDRNGKIVDVNPAGQILAGRERAELLGMDMTNFLRPDDLPLVRGYVKDLLEGRPTPETLEIDVRSSDGRLKSLQIRSRVIDGGALEPSIEAIARDVTEQKEMQRRLLETERFAAVGEMAAFVAHEINSPLANVALLVASALRLEKDPTVREKIEKIDVQRHRAANIITQILSFSRRPEVRPTDMDLREVVKAAAEQAEAFRKPEVSFVKELGDHPIMAHVDSIQMQGVFVNLIKNAFEATESGVVEVRVREGATTFAVSVRDTGSGISPETVRRLFTPFFTTKRAGGGTGLGLAFSRNIIFAHEGSIELQSKVGQGSTFTVFLPRGGTP